MNILLVEDDRLLADGVISALRREGFTINHISDGNTAVSQIRAEPPDILILDLGLPGMDGIDVLKTVRRTNRQLPVLILTARDRLDDKVAGLDSGADDYLTKPFETRELLARLRVLERRISTTGSAEITVGPVRLNSTTQDTLVDDDPVNLTRREYMILKALMQGAGLILSRENLEAKLYTWGEEIASNAIEVHIHHLRKKLPDGFIQTVHGMGYIVRQQ